MKSTFPALNRMKATAANLAAALLITTGFAIAAKGVHMEHHHFSFFHVQDLADNYYVLFVVAYESN